MPDEASAHTTCPLDTFKVKVNPESLLSQAASVWTGSTNSVKLKSRFESSWPCDKEFDHGLTASSMADVGFGWRPCGLGAHAQPWCCQLQQKEPLLGSQGNPLRALALPILVV